MLTVDEAREAILADVRPLGPERVLLTQARGRVLAETIEATGDHPAFDNSAMDGYAVHWDDVRSVADGATVSLPVSMEVPAGAVPTPLAAGAAARIMTGGRLPEGADTVIMREDTDESDPDKVTIRALPGKGQGAHIRRRGENIAKGSAVMSPGMVLRGGEMGLLATFGRSALRVSRRPRVAIVSTGDELVELDQTPGPGQIVGSSSYALAALVEEAGGVAIPTPIAPDRLEETVEVFEQAIRGADLVVSIGGVSVGDYDVVKAALERLCEDGLTFWRVRMKPGKPLAFGVSKVGAVPMIGLPGNPVSAFVSFWQFVRPAMQKAMGRPDLTLPRVKATLLGPIRSTPKRLDLQRGHLSLSQEGGFEFRPFVGQGSGNPRTLVGVTGLAQVPIGSSRLEEGDPVWVEVLPGFTQAIAVG